MLRNSCSCKILCKEFHWIYLWEDIKLLLVTELTKGLYLKCKSFITYVVTLHLCQVNIANNNNNNLTRQVQQQSWQPLAKRTNMLILAPIISLSPSPLRPWEFSTHQLASSWLNLEKESQLILARLERPVICFRGFLFWCSASMLFCCTTVCRPLTARTDDRTHLCIS